MAKRPENFPDDFETALNYLMGVKQPTIDDFKLMIYVEAGGEAFYSGLANAAPNEEIATLLNKNGREERAHAHRLHRVIKKLSGEDFPVPEPAENPYFVEPEGVVVDKDMLTFLVDAETAGDNMYAGWADSVDDAECADWLRQNGKEEIRHGERAKQALQHL